MSRIFISHSSADNEAAQTLIVWLKQQGFQEVFLDFDRHHGIPPGEDWERRLYGEIQRATAVVLMLTRNWFDSKWCFVEFAQARAQGKSVLPVIVTADGNQFLGDSLQKIDLVADREDGLSRLLDRLRNLSLDGPAGFMLPKGRSPYPGLLSFDSNDAAVFFGREPELRETIEQLERLRRRGGAQVLYMHGESGSGKSSLLKAGVWPHLCRMRDEWLLLPMFRPGVSPLAELRAALRAGGVPSELIDKCYSNPTPEQGSRLIDALREHAGRFQATLLISIDQFEESFTLPNQVDQDRFVTVLACLLSPGHKAIAVATLRTADLPRSAETLVVASEERLIGPFPLDRLPDIVRKPAQVAGIEVEDNLIAVLSRDVTSANALPMVAYLLRRLYDRFGSSFRLTLAEYESLKDTQAGLRPLETCVRDAADKAIKHLDPKPDELAALREAFVPGLVRISDIGQFIRRPLSASEIEPAAHRLIDALIDERLLVRRDDGSIEVAHEALYRVWPLLSGWLAEEREFLLGKSRIEAAHFDWLQVDPSRRSDALLTGLLLGRAESWLRQHPNRFQAEERKLIEESVLAREKSIQGRRRAQRILIRSAVSAAIVFATLGGAAWLQRNEARRQAQLASQQTERAHKQERLAREQASFAQEQEAIAKEQTAKAIQQERIAIALATEAKRERSQAEQQSYFVLIEAAKTQLDRGQRDEAARLLKEAPTTHRNWEWGFLSNQTKMNPITVIHGGLCNYATFSRNGKLILTVGANNDAKTWDASNGRERRNDEGAQSFKYFTPIFSPDDSRLIRLAENENDALIVNARSSVVGAFLMGQAPIRLHGHAGKISRAAFSPDGSRVLTTSKDKTARVWETKTGKEIAVLNGHEDEVYFGGFNHDGSQIVTTSSDTTVRVWDTSTGMEVSVLRGHSAATNDAVFSPDGTQIVSASGDHTARVWSVADGHEITVLRGHEHWVTSVMFSPDGKRILTASTDKTARVWEADTGRETVRFSRHENYIWSAIFSHDGTRVVTASDDKTARVWDAATGREINVLRGHAKELKSAVFSADDRLVLTASWDGTAKVWNTCIEKDFPRSQYPDWFGGTAFSAVSPDGTQMVKGMEAENTAHISAKDTGKVSIALRGHVKSVACATFSPDGNIVATGSFDNTARIWDARTGRQLAVLEGHESTITSVVFSPDSKWLVTTSEPYGLRRVAVCVWDAATGRELVTLKGHTATVYSAEFSSDGARVVTASFDKTARVWNAASGTEIARLQGHDDTVWSASFSPDGLRVVTASGDKTARVWDANTGRELIVLSGYEDSVHDAAFSYDGTQLVTAAEGKLRVWDSIPFAQRMKSAEPSLVPRVKPRGSGIRLDVQ